MPTLDPKMYSQPAECALKIINGAGTGSVYPLFIGSSLTIGKAKSCDVFLEVLTDKVSHKHARLTAAGDSYLLENLSQSHPLIVNNHPIDKDHLLAGERFQIHDITFLLEPPEFEFPRQQKGKKAGEKKSSGKKLTLRWLLSIALLLSLFWLFFLVLGEGEDEEAGTSQGASQIGERPLKGKEGESHREKPEESGDVKIRPEGWGKENTDPEKSREANGYFRQGKFFYENGNLKSAILHWRKATALVPQHEQAQTWLERTEDELDKVIERHYQDGLKALKYMRTEDAIREFEIVEKLALDKEDQRAIGARQRLQDLRKERE